jgi:hypothetical protein
MLEFLLPERAATKAGLTPACASLSIVARIIITLVVGVLILDFLPPDLPPLRLREQSLFLGSQSFPLSEGGGECMVFLVAVDNEAAVFFRANDGFLVVVVVVAVVAEFFFEAEGSQI